MPLTTYRRKRDFKATPEPKGEGTRPRGKTARSRKGLLYVIQKHAASRLHYDFRLELDGVLKSWAVPKGPSLDPGEKRLAVEVEDHPLEYGSFEGRIPKGQYGGGSVLLWDRGTWIPLVDPHEGLRRGKLEFELHAKKLSGRWALIRMSGRAGEDGKKNWLLIKERDPGSKKRAAKDILVERPESVKSGRTIEEVGPRIWNSNRRRASAAAALDPASLPGARPAALPRWAAPQLATLVSSPPEGEGWIHEIKYDGYRFLCRVDRGAARLLTRSGLDWTRRFEGIASAASQLTLTRGLLDGELVVIRPDGVTSFQELQNALRGGHERDLVFFAFDLLHLDGFDLTQVPLLERKGALERVLRSAPASEPGVRYSDHVLGQGSKFYREACRRGLEGIVSKRAESPYTSGRTGSWLKTKCMARQEFVIGGFTEPRGSRSDLGALLLGVRAPDAGLRYAGKVGTGFTQDSLRELRRRLKPLETASPPFTDPPRMRGVHWVKPRLVAEVSFTQWTQDGKVRHPSFQGLREDKPAAEVVAERPVAPSAKPRPSTKSTRVVPPGKERGPSKRRTPKRPPRRRPPVRDPVSKPPIEEPPPPSKAPIQEPPEPEAKAIAGVRITHPAKVLYPEEKLTKLDVARYLESVASRMLPQIEGRPLMLLRCPEGRGGECFFQKHPGSAVPASLEPVRIREASGKMETYLTVRSATGLVSMVQMGALEIHVWGARADRIEAPDRIVFDLDPDPTVGWAFVIETAHRLRERLEEIGLTSFAKTTGGKGIHVVVPIRRGPGWEAIRALSTGIAMSFVREQPDRYTTNMAKDRRKGRIFIDTLRNRRGATWVAPYSMRARSGAPVSAPLGWSELTPKLRTERLNVLTIPERLSGFPEDPWKGMDTVRQTVTAAMLRKVGAPR